MTEEAMMFEDSLSVDENLDFIYEDVEERLCTNCRSEPFYDSESNEYYCPICDQ